MTLSIIESASSRLLLKYRKKNSDISFWINHATETSPVIHITQYIANKFHISPEQLGKTNPHLLKQNSLFDRIAAFCKNPQSTAFEHLQPLDIIFTSEHHIPRNRENSKFGCIAHEDIKTGNNRVYILVDKIEESFNAELKRIQGLIDNLTNDTNLSPEEIGKEHAKLKSAYENEEAELVKKIQAVIIKTVGHEIQHLWTLRKGEIIRIFERKIKRLNERVESEIKETRKEILIIPEFSRDNVRSIQANFALNQYKHHKKLLFLIKKNIITEGIAEIALRDTHDVAFESEKWHNYAKTFAEDIKNNLHTIIQNYMNISESEKKIVTELPEQEHLIKIIEKYNLYVGISVIGSLSHDADENGKKMSIHELVRINEAKIIHRYEKLCKHLGRTPLISINPSNHTAPLNFARLNSNLEHAKQEIVRFHVENKKRSKIAA